MTKLQWNWTDDREKACNDGLAIKHRDGHIGYIEYNGGWGAKVVFPDWNGKRRTAEYDRHSPSITILDTKYKDHIKQKEITMNALYEITKEDGTKVFATKMAEKSKTLWVMEIKGTGEFVAVDVAQIQEVVPYTIKIKDLASVSTSHHEAEEGKFAVGDLLLSKSGGLGMVVELNTKVKGSPELKVYGKVSIIPV